MANPKKSELKTALNNGIDAVISHDNPMSDTELAAALNSTLATAKTVDPIKGTPTVKF